MSLNRQNVRPQASAKGAGGRLGYFTRKALANLASSRLVTLITVCTITLALLIISLFMLIYLNMEGTIEQWSRKVAVTVYFDREPSSPELASLKSRIAALPGTESVQYVSKEDALKKFRSRLKGQESLLDGVSADILPSSLEISLKKEFRATDSVNVYVSRLKHLQGVGEVQYGEEWVKKFLTFFQVIRVLGLMIAVFLVMAVLFIVSNTIKLTVLARQDEIEILALVGATPFFIKAPFLIEGMLQGAVGGITALALLTGGYFALLANAVNFLSFNPAEAGLTFLPLPYMVALVIGGVALGFIGSLVSLKKLITI
ncbi:MAG: ABC transporter permease [Geobacteraceae bacterium]|nr:ABC transporter permease [Geobacteraceae bacterium]